MDWHWVLLMVVPRDSSSGMRTVSAKANGLGRQLDAASVARLVKNSVTLWEHLSAFGLVPTFVGVGV
jgi:hypothetical protein